jgi:hypothetical protein
MYDQGIIRRIRPDGDPTIMVGLWQLLMIAAWEEHFAFEMRHGPTAVAYQVRFLE